MKIRHFFSALLMVMAAIFAAMTIAITVYAMQAEPVIRKVPDAAAAHVSAFLNAVSAGNYGAAEQYLYGAPSLGQMPGEVSPAMEMIWAAFLGSLDCTFQEQWYMENSALTVDVTIRSLDVSSITQGLDARAQNRLNQRIDAAEDSSELYDENNEYRQDLISEVLLEAVREALAESSSYQEQTIPLHMVYEQGQWWILPETALLNALSGSITG